MHLFWTGPQQLLVLAVAIILWIGLAAIGYLVTGRARITEANPFVGWAVVSSLFTIVGVFLPQPFVSLADLVGLVAIAGAFVAWRRGEPLFLPGMGRLLVIVLPLLFVVSAMQPSQWDEFANWLPQHKYLYLYNGFPTAERPDAGAPTFSGYPYGLAFLAYLAARTSGGFVENVVGLLNTLMLMTTAVFALRTAFAVTGRPRGDQISWGFAAASALVATAFNPTFVPKIIFTAYSDTASATATAIAILLGYRLLEERSNIIAWQLGLLLALVVNIRQPNLVVAVIVLGAMTLIALRDPALGVRPLLQAAPVVLLPAIIVYGLWRYYVIFRGGGFMEEGHIMPFAQWNWPQALGIAQAMLIVALKKSGFFVTMAIASVLAIRALWRGPDAFGRICIQTASLFVGYNAFLFFIYIAHFEDTDATNITSYWRYNIDVGTVAMIFIPCAALLVWNRFGSFDRYPKWLAPTAAALLIAAPLAAAPKLRFDLEEPKPHIQAVAHDIGGLGIDANRLHFFDPAGTGESPVIMRYRLSVAGKGSLAGADQSSPAAVAAFLSKVATGDYVIALSLAPGFVEGVGQPLEAGHSYLMRRDESGWTLLKTWTQPR